MKNTAPLRLIQRRLAKDVLQSVQTAEKSGEPGNPYFNELPQVLQTFFQKYPPSPFRKYSEKPGLTNDADANPFLANKHPVTQRWHKPQYSMRRQADLWKAAYRFGIEHLMPKLLHGKTFYEERYATRKPPRGSLFFKLTKGERAAPRRAQEVQEALADADRKLADRKGKRFEKFLEKRKAAGLV